MEDQGKRVLLAVAAAFGIMLLWQVLFPPDKKPAPKSDTAAQTTPAQAPAVPAGPPPVAAPGSSSSTPAVPPTAPPTVGTPAATAEAPVAVAPAVPVDCGPEQTLVLESKMFRATFSSWGGVLRSWELLGAQYKEAKTGKQLDLVPTGDKEEWRSFAMTFPGSTATVPPGAEWVGTRKSDTAVEFVWKSPELEVAKTYTIFPDDNLVQLTINVSVPSTAPAPAGTAERREALALSVFQYQDPHIEKPSRFAAATMQWDAACDVGGSASTYGIQTLLKGGRERHGRVRWGGFTHSYLFIGVSPKLDQVSDLSCNAYAVGGTERPGVMRVDLVFPYVNLKPGDSFQRVVTSYLGPKFLGKLERVPEITGYDTGYSSVIDLGWFGFIARPLLWLLHVFYNVLGNWGLAIIALTCFVKLATLYWNVKSMRSMRAMGQLRPKVEEIQKKYKDDKQRQQVEIMNLYKAHGVNPLSGCLPLVLQMPIWLALYQMLRHAGELYRAPFIAGWIGDMTAPDPYYILPSILMVMMLLQGKLSPTTVDGLQQKLMIYGLPLMFGAMSFFFPAGLTLYIFTNTSLTVLQNLIMNRGGKTPAGGGKTPAGAPTGGKPEGKGDGKAGGKGGGGKPVAALRREEGDDHDEGSAAEPVALADGSHDAETDARQESGTVSKGNGAGKKGPRPGGGKGQGQGSKRRRGARN